MANQTSTGIRNPDLIRAGISGLVAAVLMSYAVGVKPGAISAIVALLAVAAIVSAYLRVAKASVEPEIKAIAIVGGGAIALLCFALLSKLF